MSDHAFDDTHDAGMGTLQSIVMAGASDDDVGIRELLEVGCGIDG